METAAATLQPLQAYLAFKTEHIKKKIAHEYF
jgi:hypothetical protein